MKRTEICEPGTTLGGEGKDTVRLDWELTYLGPHIGQEELGFCGPRSGKSASVVVGPGRLGCAWGVVAIGKTPQVHESWFSPGQFWLNVSRTLLNLVIGTFGLLLSFFLIKNQ